MKMTVVTGAMIIINISLAINAQLLLVESSATTCKDVLICNCYSRLVTAPWIEAALIIHSNQRDIADYIRDIHLLIVLLNIQEDINDVKNTSWPYDMIIIIGETVDEIEQALQKLYRTPSWNPRGRYLVLYLGSRVDAMDRLFELTWKYYLVNIVGLCTNNTNIYTYFPYGGSACGKNIIAEVLGDCYHIPWKDLYPLKVPKVFNGCYIVFGSRDIPGIIIDKNSTSDDARIVGFELAMINVIFHKLNVKRLEIPYEKLANLSATGFYNSLVNQSEMAYGQVSLSVKYTDILDYSHVFCQDHLKWIVPIAQLGEQWKNIFIIFQNTLWYTVLGILIVNIIIWWLVSKASNDGMTFMECVLGSWVALLNGTPRFPRTAAMRFLVVSWTMLCLLLITSYQSKLLAVLLKPIYEPQIANEQDILDNNLDTPHYSEMAIYLDIVVGESKSLASIASRARIISFPEYDYLRRYPNKYTAILQRELTIQYYFAHHYTDENGKSTRYIFKDPISRLYFGVLFRKGHPLLNKFNKVLDRIVDGGLMSKWMTDTSNIPQSAGDNPVDVPLNIHQLSAAFYLLGFGFLISFIIFIAEVLFYKYSQWRFNQ